MNKYIEKALESANMLTITEFIRCVNYPIDTFMIDRFWLTMRKGQLIYVDDALITWMGYTGDEARIRKFGFMKLLKNHEYKYLTNDEYEKFVSSPVYTGLYPTVDRSMGKGKTKHILLTADTLRKAIMKVNTNRGDRIREYYIQLENLFITYTEYQAAKAGVDYENQLRELKLACAEFTRNCAVRELEKNISRGIGCVYFIECFGRVKIGYTYDLATRLSEIRICCPFPITVIRTINTDRPEGLEAELHGRFADKRVCGEWFEITAEDIAAVIAD